MMMKVKNEKPELRSLHTSEPTLQTTGANEEHAFWRQLEKSYIKNVTVKRESRNSESRVVLWKNKIMLQVDSASFFAFKFWRILRSGQFHFCGQFHLLFVSEIISLQTLIIRVSIEVVTNTKLRLVSIVFLKIQNPPNYHHHVWTIVWAVQEWRFYDRSRTLFSWACHFSKSKHKTYQ